MRVFLAGATGVIGRALLPRLLEHGHDVTAMTRREERAAELREAGAVPAVCDVFDAEGVREAVERARPEVVLHELTDLPPAIDPRKLEVQVAGNDRIRTEGTRNLVAAAVAAGARRIVAQSIAFAYAPTGERLKGEDDALWDDAPWPWSRSVAALRDLEDAVTNTEGVEGVVLRYGFFYGPGTSYARGGYYESEVRRRRFPLVGRGSGVFSFIHVDDAADATVAAVERGVPGIYNVVDDEPAPLRAWLPEYAQAIGAKPPRRVPRFLARMLGGRYAVAMATDLRGAANARAKAELGWAPRHSSWRQGFGESLGQPVRDQPR
jgi:nucleoside-diphosphate-sugar epimerase